MLTKQTFLTYIEIPQGGGQRQRLHETMPAAYAGNINNVPAFGYVAYGCLPKIINPADNCEADVFILDADAFKTASYIQTRIIGMHIRNNGDHKLLAVLPESELKDIKDVNPTVLEKVGAFVDPAQRPGEFWASANTAHLWLQSLER